MVIAGSPDESDPSNDTEIIDHYTCRSLGNLVRRAGPPGPGQIEQRRYIKNKFEAEDSQFTCPPLPLPLPFSYINKLASGSADPFLTLPNLIGGDTDLLTHHWHTVFVHTTTPPGPRKQWFPSSIADPALFHGILHISAAHIAGSQRKRPSPAYFRHRGEVIRLVNKRITYDHNATNDGTIGAIACLLISDSMSGHPERARAHLAGIQQLLLLRGGISTLSPLIQKLVRWVDLLSSISFLERPLFCPPQMIDPNLNNYYGPPSLSTTFYTLAFCNRLVNFTGLQRSSDIAARIFWGLRNLSILKDTANITEGLSYESISFSDRVEMIERETENLLHDTLQDTTLCSDSKKPSPSIVLVLFAYATLIYINSSFRELVPSFITTVLAHRLEGSMDIEDSELNILLGTFPELMLWVLFLGGGAAWSKSKIWFAKTASKILRVQKLEEEKGITTASTSFLWPEGRENYDDSTGDDEELTEVSPVELAFASVLPSALAVP